MNVCRFCVCLQKERIHLILQLISHIISNTKGTQFIGQTFKLQQKTRSNKVFDLFPIDLIGSNCLLRQSIIAKPKQNGIKNYFPQSFPDYKKFLIPHFTMEEQLTKDFIQSFSQRGPNAVLTIRSKTFRFIWWSKIDDRSKELLTTCDTEWRAMQEAR